MARVHVSVVTGKNDQRLFVQPVSLERIENASDMSIDLLRQAAIDPTIDLPLPFVVDLAHCSGGGHRVRLGVEFDRIGFKLRNSKVVPATAEVARVAFRMPVDRDARHSAFP